MLYDLLIITLSRYFKITNTVDEIKEQTIGLESINLKHTYVIIIVDTAVVIVENKDRNDSEMFVFDNIIENTNINKIAIIKSIKKPISKPKYFTLLTSFSR